MSDTAADRRRPWGQWGRLLLGPTVFAAIAFLPSALHRVEGYGHRPALAAGVFAWMAAWWLFEAVPFWVTSCLPLLLYPWIGVTGEGPTEDFRVAALPFVDAYIFLFLGGMSLGAAMEKWNLHRRIALHTLKLIGTQPKRLLLGVLVATALVSMWISNTATAVMMMPIAMALLSQLEVARGQGKLGHFGAALMLAVAYGANLGGVGTKIGTATNSIYAGFLSEEVGYDISFLHYAAVGTPVVVLFIPVIWLWLWQVGRHDALGDGQGQQVIEKELALLGPMGSRERQVSATFATAALLWIFSDLLRPLVAPFVPVFWDGFRFSGKHYEALVAMAAAVFLLLSRTLTLKDFRRIPWGALLLLGGSFALAAGMENSGLALLLSSLMSGMSAMPLVQQLLITNTATVLMSAIASNTATVNVMLNLLPRSLTVLTSCAFASSFDFALPAGTPPNAIVFGSGYIRLPVMMRVGVVLDLVAIVFLTVYSAVFVRLLMPN